jgi:hypothetical protein
MKISNKYNIKLTKERDKFQILNVTIFSFTLQCFHIRVVETWRRRRNPNTFVKNRIQDVRIVAGVSSVSKFKVRIVCIAFQDRATNINSYRPTVMQGGI